MTTELSASQRQLADGVTALLGESSGAHNDRLLLEPLRLLPPRELAALLQAIDLRRLLRRLDRRLTGHSTYSAEFLTLLEAAVEFLSLEAKVVAAQALADGPTSYREEKVLRALFLSETGATLTELKLRLDSVDSGHDLLDIVTGDIDSPELRYDILKHFRTSAEIPKDPRERPLRVISDIDDTLYSALKDARHPRGTLYKGVLELFASLSALPPVFLTARPELVASLFERWTHKQLRRYGLSNPTVLSGSLVGLLSHRRMAEQKARTLLGYTEMYPEFRFLFFGDSGQGDMALAHSLLSYDTPVIERAFIHRLSEFHSGAQTDHRYIHLFDDYASAAEQLHQLGYLDEVGRDKVAALVQNSG